MKELFLVGVGGVFGAIARYLVGGWIQHFFPTFPMGTMLVNFVGSFFLSFIMYLSEYGGIISRDVRLFLTVGLLGAFTTMSTFEYESFRMLEGHDYIHLTINVLGNVIGTIFAVFLGKEMAILLRR